jgi:succinyl-CoA synthetase beta subunit
MKYGVTVPKGMVIISNDELRFVSLPTVLKAQVPVGGRGKAGAVKFVNDKPQAQAAAKKLLQSMVKGFPIQVLLAEEPIKMDQEFYVACLIDKRSNTYMLMASTAGGVNIEEVAQKSPEKIIKKWIDPVVGIEDHVIRFLVKALDIENQSDFSNVIKTIYAITQELDATLVEINPLARTGQGLVALDAKIIIDDKAAFRHMDFFKKIKTEQKKVDPCKKTTSQLLAAEMNLNYLPLDGNIGLIADGAGTGMLTMDLIHDAGAEPANFCEMGGLASSGIMQRTMEVILADPKVKVLLISLIGGLTRMDDMAAGIVDYLNQSGQTVPIVVRMCGTKADVGIPMLQNAGIETVEDLSTAVDIAVDLVGK